MYHKGIFARNRSTGIWLNLVVACATFLAAIPVQSQDQKQTKSDQDVIKVTSNLVSLDVIVKDKKGRPVTDLKAEDFTVIENGVPQKIEFFDSTLTSATEATPSPNAAASTERKPGITPNAFPRNIIALVLDGQSTELANLKHVREGILKYIHERISDNDSVALFAISGGLQLLQTFTHDKSALVAAVEKAYDSSIVSKTSEARGISENINSLRDKISAGPPGDTVASSPAAGAAGSAMAEKMIAQRMLEQYIQFRSVLSAQQTRPVLAALAAIAEGLRPVPGKKTVVMFSQGFVAPESLDWQVQSTIDIANRANVAIYIIDSTGLTGGTPTSGSLVAASPLAGISGELGMEQRRRSGAGESVFDITRHEGLNRQQDLLYRISEDTGGHFIKNTNDIAAGLERIDAEIRTRYTLAYRSTDPNFDGSFRKVKIEVTRPDTSVSTRAGYFAIPPTQIIPFSADERKLLANIANLEANQALPLTVGLNAFRSGDGFYTVPLSFEIPPAAVKFDHKENRERMHLEVLGVVRPQGEEKVLSRLGGNFDVALTAPQYESILNDQIYYRQDLQLYSGNYTIDLIVRDRLSGKTAAKRENLVLSVDATEFTSSDVVLSKHAEPTKTSAASRDVFSAANISIRPSLSREFHSNDNLIIFFTLYGATISGEAGIPIVKVTLTLMKDGKPAMRPFDYQLTELSNEPVPHLTFAKYVKLTGLPPGKYSAVIESRDIVQKKVVKQEAWFTIVPP